MPLSTDDSEAALMLRHAGSCPARNTFRNLCNCGATARCGFCGGFDSCAAFRRKMNDKWREAPLTERDFRFIDWLVEEAVASAVSAPRVTVPRWTVKKKVALVLRLLRGQTTIQEAARRHGLVEEEVAAWRTRFLSGAEDALRDEPG